nr:fimbrillin family protein [uncultured Bacteroides sp.]
MKRIFNRISLCSMLLITAATSCINEEAVSTTGDKVAVHISGSVNTRAVNNEWNKDDVIGITMLKDGSADIIAPYKNYNYVTPDATSSFTPATAEQIMYFPVDGSKVSFKAYYPYSSTLPADMIMPLSTDEQSNLAAIDLMTAEHIAGTSKDDPDVKLHFYHRLAKVIVNLEVEDSEIMSLEGCKLAIKGLKTAGTYDLMNEVLTIDDNSGKDVIIPITSAHGEGIILPRVAGEGVTFEITTANGGVYTAIMESDLEIKSGLKHIFNIKLKKTPVTVSATIEEWQEGPETAVNVVRIVTGLEASAGVQAGDTLRLLLKDEGDTDHKYAAKYTFDGINWVTDKNIYWENITADPVSFIGTTALTAKLNDTQMDDVLLSDSTTAGQYKGVNLELKHAAAKTTVTLSSPAGENAFTTEELASAIVTFPGYNYTGKVNEKGEFVISDGTHDIKAEKAEDGNYIAIFPQQEVKAGEVIAIVTIGGRDYEIKNTEDITFEQGANNKLDIKLSKTDVEVSTTVKDWDDTKAAHELEFKVDVANGTSTYFKANDVITFYKNSATTVNKHATGTCTTGTGNSVVFPNSPWKTEEFEVGDVISAVFPTTGIPAVAEGEKSFSWTSFDTTTKKPNDDILVAAHKFTDSELTPPYAESVDFTFNHVLSSVTVNIIAGTGFTANDFTSHSVALNNLYLTGDINVVTGTASATGSATPSFTPKKITTSTTAGTVATYKALIMPQNNVGDQALVTVNFGGKDYVVKGTDIAAITSFVAGSNHTINITFSKTGISLSATVKDWENGTSGSTTIE